MDYLHPKSYYDDQYDLHTIEQSLEYWSVGKKMQEKRSEFKGTDEEFQRETLKVVSYMTNILKIERFRHRTEQIGEWMERDRKIQEVLDIATPPDDIRCTACSSDTNITSRDLFDAYDKHPYVLFMFECIKCHKRQALYADGRPWHYEPSRCPKCSEALESTVKHGKDTLTTIYTCTSCSYSRKDVDDFAKSRKEREAKEKRDTELLTKYRNEFCYSEKDGQEAVQSMDTIVRVVDEIKAKEKKEADPVYQQAMKLKKISIVDMEKLIVDAVTPQKYIRFTLGQPIMGRFIEVSFTVQEGDSSRHEYDSRNELRKLIIKALEGTNWRLMSDGITFRLGVLAGRLKGLENPDDIADSLKPETGS